MNVRLGDAASSNANGKGGRAMERVILAESGLSALALTVS
jgi:hypothetical protein